MKYLATFIFMLLLSFETKGKTVLNTELKFTKLNKHYYGIDVSQFNYIFGPHRNGFNLGACYSYKPFYFLSFNSSLTYNNVHHQRNRGYSNLTHYNSKGICLKLGADVSLRLSKDRKKRIFWGYQYGFLNFKESGVFTMGNYWGAYINNYQTKAKFYGAAEAIFGLKFNIKKINVKMQFYSMLINYDSKISYHDEVIVGYQSPFIPGYGFRRGGINLIVGF